MRNYPHIATTIAAVCGLCCVAAGRDAGAQALTVTSPDGKLTLSFGLKSLPAPYAPSERPYYRVSFEGRDVLTDSPLGLMFDSAPALDHDLTVKSSSTDSHDSSWEDPINDNRTVRDHYNELTVHLQEAAQGTSAGRHLDVVFRAYNEGIAFRYVLPQQPALQKFVLSNEYTGFYFARPAATFALKLDSFTTPYEDEFRKMALGEISTSSLVGLPLLVHLHDGSWVAITEAGLEDYAGMYISGAYHIPNGLAARLSPLPNPSPAGGGSLNAHGIALARADGERAAGWPHRKSRPRPQPQSAVRA